MFDVRWAIFDVGARRKKSLLRQGKPRRQDAKEGIGTVSMKPWKIIAAALLIFLIGVIGYVIHRVNHVVTVTVPNAYAMEWVSGMVIGHMEANQGQWPRGWDELRDDYEAAVEQSGGPWSFEDLRSRSSVDWDADPKELVQAEWEGDGPPFYVVTVKEGKHVYWEPTEPNTRILEYLRQREVETEKQP